MDCNLSQYRINTFSQFGEDGVIEKLFEIAGIKSGWLVEFGAWDAVHLSNTRYHYLKGGFDLLLVESDNVKYSEIRDNYTTLFPAQALGPTSIGPIVLNAKIQAEGKHCLNNVFSNLSIENNIALLSIDIDGEDLNIWNSLDKTLYRPKVVVIEFGKWQEPNELNYLVSCFEGYNLVYVTGNFIFIDAKLNIRSNQNVHELIRASGMQEYDKYFGKITEQAEHECNTRQFREKDMYTKLAEPQILYYEQP